jgi:hypothetical protein
VLRPLLAAIVLAAAVAAAVVGVPVRAQQIDDDAPLAEIAAFIEARAAFERHCNRCHTTAGDETSRKAIDKLDMDRYPFRGKRAAFAGSAVRKSLGQGGGKATMPKDNPDTVSAEDLTLMFKWADTFDAARGKKDKN